MAKVMTSPAADLRTRDDARSLPGPPGLPIIGNALQFPPSRAHQVLEDWAHRYGPMFRFRLGPREMVGVADPEAIRALFMGRPEKYTRMLPMEEVFLEMGIEGVFPVEGEQWQRQRRVWMQAMALHRIRPFFEQLTGVTERLMTRWEAAAASGDTVDVVHDLMRYTVDVTTLFAFGHDGNTLQRGDDVIQQHLMHVFPAINRRINSPGPYWRYLPLPADRKLKRALKALEAFVLSLIEDARTRMAADPELAQSPTNLLEALIAASGTAEDALTDQEIFGNTVGVLLAGEDTTAYTLAWMIHELMDHPQIAERLRENVDNALGTSRVWSELSETEELTFVDAVMSETLRLRPVAPINGMTAKVDVELAGRRFPAGTSFMIPLRAPAVSDEQFDSPREFRPERWLEDSQNRHAQKPPHPFGGGRRACPGRNLAMMEIRSVTSMLMRNFEFRRPEGAPPVREKLLFTLCPDGLQMVLKKRH